MRLIFPLLLLFIVGCKVDPSQSIDTVKDVEKVVSSRYQFPKFTISNPENVFVFSDSKDQILETKKMSRIYVDKNSFVDLNGNDVQGNIELVFKEYHSTGEILASKLPMVFKSESGEVQDFESAGMFEITANQDGKALKLKPNKTIQVDLISDNKRAFNFYDFNEKEMVWNEKDTDCKPIANQVKLDLIKERDSLTTVKLEKPRKPIELSEKDEIFDININFDEYQEISDLNGVMWKITEPDDSIRKKAKSVLFEKKFNSVRLEPLETDDLEFKLVFIQNKDSLAFMAAPVMKGKLLSKQKEKYKSMIASITSNAKKLNRIQDQIKREKDMLRSFNVDQLAIYNYDIQFKDENAIPILANFTFDGAENSELDEVSVYLIPSSKKVVVQYTKDTFEKFSINPKENNKIIAVLPNNQVYYLSNKDIHDLNLEDFRQKKKEIRLKKYSKIGESSKLDELIAKI